MKINRFFWLNFISGLFTTSALDVKAREIENRIPDCNKYIKFIRLAG